MLNVLRHAPADKVDPFRHILAGCNFVLCHVLRLRHPKTKLMYFRDVTGKVVPQTAPNRRPAIYETVAVPAELLGPVATALKRRLPAVQDGNDAVTQGGRRSEHLFGV